MINSVKGLLEIKKHTYHVISIFKWLYHFIYENSKSHVSWTFLSESKLVFNENCVELKEANKPDIHNCLKYLWQDT